ncbi:MAG: UDP-N-acetylglucosamine 1-carboxyvinyltransferase [Clostridia bacterium]|nr:UDP-N-acetylglucosamine 1-carboxyvinyltransferase [Clostridia bacterium]
MSVFIVRGGRPLSGSIEISGAKNSVLPILAATLVNAGVSVLHNCPDLRDVTSAIKILQHLGCKVTRQGRTITVDSTQLTCCDVPDKLMREMRSSIMFLGPIIARCGKARISMPGGCELGARPIDLHLEALRKLGVSITESGGEMLCEAGRMQGRDIILSFPSVGATENIMLAATACDGVTRIINAAREPEICDLQEFLRKAGANLTGAGGSEITIAGGNARRDATHRILPDRIEAATYLCAAAACGGDVELRELEPAHVGTVISCLRDAGCDIRIAGRTARITSTGRLTAMNPVRTMPYPGFPTDAQAPLMAAACVARGSTLFLENIFENRFRHTAELARMGADIRVSGRMAVVEGGKPLHGAAVQSTDLRGGAALVIAALCAQGESEISDIYHIERGYESMEKVLSSLGADMERVEK